MIAITVAARPCLHCTAPTRHWSRRCALCRGMAPASQYARMRLDRDSTEQEARFMAGVVASALSGPEPGKATKT